MSTVWCDGQQYPHYFIIGLIIHILGALLTIGALLHYIFSLKSDASKVRPIFKWLLIVSSTICITMCSFGSLSFIACYFNQFSLSRASRSIFLFSMLCNSTILIYSLILRIYQTFQNSVYQVQQTLYIGLCTSFFIGAALYIIGSAIYWVFYVSNKLLVSIGFIICGVGVIPVLSVWFIVMFLFFKKLFLLSMECRQSENEPSSINRSHGIRTRAMSASSKTASNAGPNVDDTDIGRSRSHSKTKKAKKASDRKQKEKIILVATRHVVLNGYLVIHTFASFIVVFLTNNGAYDAKSTQILGDVMMIFGFVNFFAVYLQYDCTTTLYSKLCCCMDKCCYSMLDKCIEIKIGIRNDEQTMTDIVSKNNTELSSVENV